MVAVRKTLVVIGAGYGEAFGQRLRNIKPELGHADAVFDQLGSIGQDFARHLRAGAAGEELGVNAEKAGGKVRRMTVVELGETQPSTRGELIRETGIDFEKKFFCSVVAARVVGIGVPVADPVFLIVEPKATAE